MNYELAKKLKDAGFSQGKSGSSDNCDIHWHRDMNDITNPNTEVYFPTLSELIEACGERFSKMTRSQIGVWYCSEKGHKRSVGKTPEEAVANLWLKLNEKLA